MALRHAVGTPLLTGDARLARSGVPGVTVTLVT